MKAAIVYLLIVHSSGHYMTVLDRFTSYNACREAETTLRQNIGVSNGVPDIYCLKAEGVAR